MLTRQDLSAEHTELDQLAVQLLAAVASADGPAPGLSSIRWKLTRVLIAHLAKEDRLLYPRLQSCGDPRTEMLAKRFADEMGGLAEAYLAYANGWTIDSIAADWPGFARDTRKIAGALQQRIMREERDLYPMLDAQAQSRNAA